jgi:hypothetical protein
MKRQILSISILLLSFCTPPSESNVQKISISKIEMHLSAFGVESDDFASIEAYVDFTNDSSSCTKSYYNPAFTGSIYKLSHDEIGKVLELLQNSDFSKLKKEYSASKTDQPTSTLIIYMDKRNYTIRDYGLEGDYPLPDLYKIVYKL